MLTTDRLRERGLDYRRSAERARELEDGEAERTFKAIALVLFELAAIADGEEPDEVPEYRRSAA